MSVLEITKPRTTRRRRRAGTLVQMPIRTVEAPRIDSLKDLLVRSGENNLKLSRLAVAALAAQAYASPNLKQATDLQATLADQIPRLVAALIDEYEHLITFRNDNKGNR
jgi:hypothetical protein